MEEDRSLYFKTYPERMPLTVEMHKRFWDNLFLDYSVRDLCIGGFIYENIESLNLSEETKRCILEGRFQVYGNSPQWYQQEQRGLSNYIYIGDDVNGKMKIFYFNEKDFNRPKSSNLQTDNNSRFLTS